MGNVVLTTAVDAGALSGKWLRWVVCLLLKDVRRPMTVQEIVEWLEANGYGIAGDRAGKTVSDALRWEVSRGRVILRSRGTYEAGFMQRSTEYSMRRRVNTLDVGRTAASSLVPGVDRYGPGPIDLDVLDTTDAWSGPAPAVSVDD